MWNLSLSLWQNHVSDYRKLEERVKVLEDKMVFVHRILVDMYYHDLIPDEYVDKIEEYAGTSFGNILEECKQE